MIASISVEFWGFSGANKEDLTIVMCLAEMFASVVLWNVVFDGFLC